MGQQGYAGGQPPQGMAGNPHLGQVPPSSPPEHAHPFTHTPHSLVWNVSVGCV